MKAVALGLRRYLKDKWNQLDVAIVFFSILGIILEEMESTLIPINPTIIRVMRVARIARVLKLLKMAKGIRQLLDTVMQALPQVGNLGLLFFLLFFIFAALGTELFGRLGMCFFISQGSCCLTVLLMKLFFFWSCVECDEEHPCQGLGEHAHFQHFGMAFLTLFRVATGDNWNGIMKVRRKRIWSTKKLKGLTNSFFFHFLAKGHPARQVRPVERVPEELLHLPGDCPDVLRHLRPHGAVCAGQRGGGGADEAPRGVAQADGRGRGPRD